MSYQNDNKLKTFQEWSCDNFHVKRGQHGKLINGHYYFTKDQIEENDNYEYKSKLHNGRWL
jgi:hypothetical protein